VGFLQAPVIQPPRKEEAPPTENTLILRSVKTSDSVYIVNIILKFKLKVLPVSGHLFIRLHGLESLSLVSSDFKTAYCSILS